MVKIYVVISFFFTLVHGHQARLTWLRPCTHTSMMRWCGEWRMRATGSPVGVQRHPAGRVDAVVVVPTPVRVGIVLPPPGSPPRVVPLRLDLMAGTERMQPLLLQTS